MKSNYRIYEAWCPTAVVGHGFYLHMPNAPKLIAMVEAVDLIIYRMMKA